MRGTETKHGLSSSAHIAHSSYQGYKLRKRYAPPRQQRESRFQRTNRSKALFRHAAHGGTGLSNPPRRKVKASGEPHPYKTQVTDQAAYKAAWSVTCRKGAQKTLESMEKQRFGLGVFSGRARPWQIARKNFRMPYATYGRICPNTRRIPHGILHAAASRPLKRRAGQYSPQVGKV
jgi:hypothetical protein